MSHFPRFMPYLERHRIYDLFYELSQLLGVHMPEDHVLFLRNTLVQMNDTRNKPRLLLLAPPFIDLKKVVDLISLKTGQIVISRKQMPKKLPKPTAAELAEYFLVYISENDVLKSGWIFYDYPQCEDEAKAMLKTGTSPTHTLLFIPQSKTKTSKELWYEDLDQWTTSDIQDAWNKFQKTIIDFRYIFRESFLEVNILCKPMEMIVNQCTKLLKEFPLRGPPAILRILLIGTRGARRGKIAKSLSEKIGVVPVDMSELIEEAKLCDNEIAEEINFLDAKKVPIYASIILKILQERLMKKDCLSKGWVLLKFPRDRADLMAVDAFDTPPNRIIFLSINNDDAFKRLRDIRIHKYTGVMDTQTNIDKRGIYQESNNFFIHPNDDEKRVLLEHEKYSAAYQDMVDYCGEDCIIVNASGPLEEITESILSAISICQGKGGSRPGNLNYRTTCKEDTWGMGKDYGVQQEITSPVTSTPYLFRSSFQP